MVHSCKHQHPDHLKNCAISNALLVCRHGLYTLGYASIIKSCRHLSITNFPFVVVDVGQCYTYQRAEHESSCIILSLILTRKMILPALVISPVKQLMPVSLAVHRRMVEMSN